MVTIDRLRDRQSTSPPTILESRDPTTHRLLGTVPITPPDEVEAVAVEVHVAQRSWARRPVAERGRIIATAAQVMLTRSDELSAAITRETGKTLMEASFIDVGGASMVLDWVGRYGPRYLRPERIPTPQLILKHKLHSILYRPLGVIGVISAWNYPLLVPAGPVAMHSWPETASF
jgi:acyl-CoA reductase-like NAD-dependent aldehyde dehydrogenase